MTTLKDLCRVKRLPAGEHIVPGTFTARDGAWQHKHVVLYVIYKGHQPPHWSTTSTEHAWVVGLQYLGQCYSDGRIIPCRTSHIQEFTVYHAPNQQYRGLEGYVPVEPSGLAIKKPKKLHEKKWQMVEDAPIKLAALAKLMPLPKKALVQTEYKSDPSPYGKNTGKLAPYVPLPEKSGLTVADFLI